MIDLKELSLQGLYELKLNHFEDARGSFIKVFHNDFFNKKNISLQIKESYYTISKKNVFRGMHFQLPPHDHEKYVFCCDGEILDVILDLRKNSHTYGKFTTLKLSFDKANAIFIPKGFAHGFLTLSQTATIVYNVSTTYEPEYDDGIKYDTFGYDLPIKKPIISERDQNFQSFEKFISPF